MRYLLLTIISIISLSTIVASINLFSTLNKGKKICSVTNIQEMLSKLESIPDDSIYFHASNNHFSNWIAARGKLTLASSFRSIKVSDYKSSKKRRDK